MAPKQKNPPAQCERTKEGRRWQPPKYSVVDATISNQ